MLLGGSVATLDLMTAGIRASEVGRQEPLTIVTVGGKSVFKVEIADNEASREEGLMYRPTMPADAGMLFDFKVTDRVYFWMKNTYIPLDMIFIRADGTVATIAENTKPLSEKTVPSEEPVRFVLEVNAGTAQRIGLKVGDKVLNRLMRTPAG
jgi:uncharacterized membrane protein (UPF0127 family)